MTKYLTKPQAQFEYWHARRLGKTQAQIARQYDITRQAVNKSIKLAEREVLFRLLDSAQMSGILVEWQDHYKGVLIGITPQLGNLVCVMIIDQNNNIRIFYDQAKNKNKVEAEKTIEQLKKLLFEIFGLKIGNKESFKEILGRIINL